MELEPLVGQVRAGADDPLDRLERAEAVARELSELGVKLIGVFIDEAREAGHSWGDIGERFGISRQAAQQRLTPRWSSLTVDDLVAAGRLGRLTERARGALVDAGAAAERARHATVSPAHILVAILQGDNLGTRALRTAKVSVARATKAASATLPAAARTAGASVASGAPTIDAPARRCLEAALGEALQLRHNYIGNEHLLLGVLHDDDLAAAVAPVGLTIDVARAAIVEELSALARRGS